MVLILGLAIGLTIGLLIAKLDVPAFVATLAGMLIFKGTLLLVTEETGTIIIPNDTFNAIGNGFIPYIADIPGIHLLTIIPGILAILLYIWNEINTRRKKISYHFQAVTFKKFIAKIIFISLIFAYIIWVLAGYNGLSWTVVIVAVVVAVYHVITTKTMLGRHIYAVGGSPEAAKLSGINTDKITIPVFCSISALAALSGILFTARLQSATTTAGTAFEMDAIASAYVGGTSAAGGVGKVTGSIIGALVMSSLINGMNLMGVGISLQYIIRGAVLVAAVIFDVKTRNARG